MNSLRRRAVEMAVPPLVGLAAAFVAWTGVVLAESVLRSGGWPLRLAETARLVGVAATATVVFGAVLFIARLMARTLLDRGQFALALLLAPAAAAWPAHLHSTLLTSGDRISQHAAVAGVRLGLAALFVAAWTLLWAYHLALAPGTRHLVRSRSRFLARVLGPASASGTPARVTLALLAGLVGLAVLVELCSTHLSNYVPFALSLVPAAWLLSTTLAVALVPGAAWRVVEREGAPPSVRPLTAALLLAGLTLGGGSAFVLGLSAPELHASIFARARFGALVHRLTGLRTDDVARFDLDNVREGDCPPAAGPSRLPPPPVPPEARRHVLLVSIDALRRDAVLGREGRPSVAPRLRAVLERGITPQRAIAPYPATLFAVGSALTGEAPSGILLAPALPDNVFRMTKHIFDRQHVVLPQSAWFLEPSLQQLFVQGAALHYGRGAEAETTGLLALLDAERAAGLRTFAWIHYFEPHAPYDRTEACSQGPGDVGSYLCEVEAVDRTFGRLLDHAEAQGWLEDTLVIVFSDHGQALGERGYFGHHVYLNSWIADVPLTVLAPGAPQIRPRELASLADVAPTVLHFLDLPIPAGLAGQSLLLADPPDAPPRLVVSEAFPLRGKDLFAFAQNPPVGQAGLRARLEEIQRVTKGYSPKVAIQARGMRLIIDRVSGARELFDADADPDNVHDLLAERTAEARALEAALGAWHAEQSRAFVCRIRAAGSSGQ